MYSRIDGLIKTVQVSWHAGEVESYKEKEMRGQMEKQAETEAKPEPWQPEVFTLHSANLNN